ncbi:MAG: hypothetical protein WC142_09405 [Bacteroidales bacterium]|jgi:hypothetical protein|nr:hypothetical protein [Bacteroidales bacterium]
MRISTFIILFFATAIYSFAQENDTISIPKEIQQQIEYRDSIYLPINDTKLCYVFCDNDDSLRMVVADGYIAKGVDFKKNCKIEINAPLPYEPKKGNKNVLFLHFQPDFNAEMKDCPSSNLAVFLDIGELGKQDLSKISKNIQLALYTGGPFYKFKTKGKIRGKIEVVNIENDIAHIVLILDFDLVEENITRVKVETYVRIIKQQDINKNFG